MQEFGNNDLIYEGPLSAKEHRYNKVPSLDYVVERWQWS